MATKLGFYDHHRQSYHDAAWREPEYVEGEFMVGGYAPRAGGVDGRGEFEIKLLRFSDTSIYDLTWSSPSKFLTPEVKVFGDGLRAFDQARKLGLDKLLKEERFRTREEFAQALIDLGIADRSDRKLGKEVMPRSDPTNAAGQ